MNNIVRKIFVGAIAGLIGASAFAAALTANTGTPQRAGLQSSYLAASNHIWAGSLVALNSSGKLVPASDTASTKIVGRASKEVDNTGSSYSTNAAVPVDRGVFRWVNGGSFTLADVGSLAYALDDQTVVTAAQATNDIVAGLIIDVDSGGVWVDSFAIGSQGAASFTTFSASGNGSIGGTLAVSGNTTLSANATVTSNLAVTGTATLSSTLAVTGASTFTGPATLNGTNTVFGSSLVGGTITQQTVSAYVKIQGPGGTNYYLKAFLPTGP
jgi:hypothetical protein